MIPTEIKTFESGIVWAGAVNYRHLTLLMENEKFLDMVSQKLSALGYEVTKFAGISAITNTIENLVVALEVQMSKRGSSTHRTIHVKMDGFEISFH